MSEHEPGAPREPARLQRCSRCCCMGERGQHLRSAAAAASERQPPVQRTVTDYVELTGNTQSSTTVNLVARVKAISRSVNFKDGSIVKKGDLLFAIEPSPMKPTSSWPRPPSSSSRQRYAGDLRVPSGRSD